MRPEASADDDPHARQSRAVLGHAPGDGGAVGVQGEVHALHGLGHVQEELVGGAGGDSPWPDADRIQSPAGRLSSKDPWASLTTLRVGPALGMACTTAPGRAVPAASRVRPERMEALGSRARFKVLSPSTDTLCGSGAAKPALETRRREGARRHGEGKGAVAVGVGRARLGALGQDTPWRRKSPGWLKEFCTVPRKGEVVGRRG